MPPGAPMKRLPRPAKPRYDGADALTYFITLSGENWIRKSTKWTTVETAAKMNTDTAVKDGRPDPSRTWLAPVLARA